MTNEDLVFILGSGVVSETTHLPFFNSPERIEHLRAVADSWRGTPFHAHGRVKGPRGGCSCQSLAAEIGRECGWLPPAIQLPRGSLKKWRAQRLSQIVPFIETHLSAFLSPIEPTELQAGDVTWYTDESSEHLGTMLSERDLVHAILPGGVSFNRIDDALFKIHIERAWRPIQ